MKNAITFFTILGILYSFVGCSKNSSQEENNPQKEQLTAPKMKIEFFNNVNKTRDVLSKNGIGKLGNWREDELGFISNTEYFDMVQTIMVCRII